MNFHTNFILLNSIFIILLNLKQIKSIDQDLVKIKLNDKQIQIEDKDNNTFNKNKNNEIDPLWYLNKFGYLDKNFKAASSKKSAKLMMLPVFNSTKTNDTAIQLAIKKFQKFARLNQTGKIDNETLKMMKMPRCGHPDILEDDNKNSFRKRRYALQGSKWPRNKLYFRVGKYPKYGSMSKESINSELKRAFDLWSQASDVQVDLINEKNTKNFGNLLLFTGTPPLNKNDPADIDVRFESGYHGDSEPFDGSGLILGHAYFPEFGGSTHFDADELWTSRSNEGVNLYQVAVHEFGHALGLEHSDNFDAIMAPFFRGYTNDFKLHPDDLTAIEMLYGKKKRPNKTRIDLVPNFRNNMPNVYQNELENFDFLKPSINLIPSSSYQTRPTERRKFLITKISNQYPPQVIEANPSPEFNNRFNQQPGFFDQPVTLCIDGKFDAITVLSDGYTYVFKDAYVFKIDSNFVMDKNYPKLINNVFRGWNGLTYNNLPSNLDTVLYIPDNGITYFFKNNLYWRSSKLYELDPGYPRLISDNFKGLNSQNGFNGKLDASFVWSGNRRVYFVQNNRYWRYDFDLGSVEPGYPKSLSIWRGLPRKITDAFLWVNGVTYFFDNEKYYRFNDLAFKVEEDAAPRYPRLNKDYWFGCNSVNRFGKLILSSTISNFFTDLPDSSREIIEYERIEKGLNFSIIQPTTSKIDNASQESKEQNENKNNSSIKIANPKLGTNDNKKEETNTKGQDNGKTQKHNSSNSLSINLSILFILSIFRCILV